MTVSAALLVRDPPIDRLALLVEYLRPLVSQYVIVVDDRTQRPAWHVMAGWPRVQLVPFHWIDDFSVARNAALPHVAGDWVLHVDPDELPSAAMLDFVRTVDASEWADVEWQGVTYPAPRGYLFFTRNYFDGVQGDEWEEHWHCRLFRAGRGRWYKPVHEQVLLDERTEGQTRGTALLPKAPRAACLLHSRLNDDAIDRQYAALGERGQSGAAA